MIKINLENKNVETIINELNKTFTDNDRRTVAEIKKNEEYAISSDEQFVGDLFYLDYVYYNISEKELMLYIDRKYYDIPNDVGLDSVDYDNDEYLEEIENNISDWDDDILDTLTDLLLI